jgi:6-pyruvoyltetrahydropterin/6-carboxytetrahydropterin synthase
MVVQDSVTVTVRHNAELAHRLPILPGKCQNLHGHSWQFAITVRAPMDKNGVTVEYGNLKSVIRGWIDEYLDHGTALGIHDPLVPALRNDKHHKKTFVFGDPWSPTSKDLLWPTVENMAILVSRVVTNFFTVSEHRHSFPGCVVTEVVVQETAVNLATWTSPK